MMALSYAILSRYLCAITVFVIVLPTWGLADVDSTHASVEACINFENDQYILKEDSYQSIDSFYKFNDSRLTSYETTLLISIPYAGGKNEYNVDELIVSTNKTISILKYIKTAKSNGINILVRYVYDKYIEYSYKEKCDSMMIVKYDINDINYNFICNDQKGCRYVCTSTGCDSKSE